tara:strand:+ start:34 stop:435 length:402 start_codon:yes stop_codon:yes gene_type:complete
MTTTSKKFSEHIDPEIPKERIIDALKSSNKLDAAQATALYKLRNAVFEYQRQMGTSHEGLSEQMTNETHRMTQFIIGDMAAQFSEQNEFIKNMFFEPLKILEKLHDIVLMQSKIPQEIPDGEYLEDPDEAESF